MFAADSLSRTIARNAPRDTLTVLWHTDGSEAHPLERPRTVRLGPQQRVWITDAERNRLQIYDANGALLRDTDPTRLDVPYLSGLRGDTAVVFNAGTNRFDWIADGDSIRSVPIQRSADATLIYTLATDRALYTKIVGEEMDGRIQRRDDRTGAVVAQTTLTGPHWQYAGFLRAWGDSLLSLSGFRPTADVLPRAFEDGAALDSLAFRGFDSPMLPRRYAFVQGDVNQAPLLSVSAAARGPYLFVLNLRTGWVRIDVYDRNGQLQHILTPAERPSRPNFYPIDLDVQTTSEGYRMAVIRRSPSPRLTVYRWAVPSDAT